MQPLHLEMKFSLGVWMMNNEQLTSAEELSEIIRLDKLRYDGE